VTRAQAKPKITEAQFQAQVDCLLDWAGFDHYHTHDSRRSDGGFPDLIAVNPFVSPARKLAIELKVKPNKPTSEQLYWLETMRLCGFEIYVWYPEDWPLIEAVLSVR